MTQMIRREAICMVAGTGAGAVLGLTGKSLSASGPSTPASPAGGGGSALVQGTLTSAHIDGRRMTGFLETGVRGGHVLCSLMRQDERNPAVQSVFASPAQKDGQSGVEVTISFFTEPLGDVTFTLLHVGGPVAGQTARANADGRVG